jgi:hypothetical protein
MVAPIEEIEQRGERSSRAAGEANQHAIDGRRLGEGIAEFAARGFVAEPDMTVAGQHPGPQSS